MKKIELLAPAGDREKLETALYFGADAVYFAGKNYGLRAYAGNFEDKELKEGVALVHSFGKKAYVTLNVFARNKDFNGLEKYLKVLKDAEIDACIVSDLGMFMFIREHEPELAIHVSTQANTTNKFSANAWAKLGAKRIILARELSLEEITEIVKSLPKNIEVETFVHGAMCISYSGRCLLSNYLTGRDSNHGECVQACRWHYSLVEDERPNDKLSIEEDERGAYILNSKDMCLIEYLDKLSNAGISSFKVEGRMKSPYYVATVINSYRRALDLLYKSQKEGKPYVLPKELKDELYKASHRAYTTGFMLNDEKLRQNYESSSQIQESVFIAKVLGMEGEGVVAEQRNKFSVGDTLEILSPGDEFNKTFKVAKIVDSKGNSVQDAKLVQEKVIVYPDRELKLQAGDILRK
ncbi:MAG: U32 family peptidase [Clostridia bacterium]|nr:U32 family peptidase [Clostridia bacterium]